MHDDDYSGIDRVVDVPMLTRVEGEGRLLLRVQDGEVTEARLSIFEPPRYFEKLVCGRHPDEVIDIVARICGICPVAYQMSAVHAFEDCFGVEVEPGTRQLRRLFYCGEWVESHALHVHLLHAPDFLGYPSAVEMARDHKAVVERGLEIKKAGNALVTLLGGRPIHPVSVRVGGWSKVPTRAELGGARDQLAAAADASEEVVRLVATFEMPPFERDMPLVALRGEGEYPMCAGRVVSTTGIDVPGSRWDDAFAELQEPGSNALHARTRPDGGVYATGPSARVACDADLLHPRARAALEATGLAELVARNPFAAIVARAVETLHASSIALDIVDAYEPPSEPRVPWEPTAGRAAWTTEAPRGILFHRYEMDAGGHVVEAQIVPPTSQNQGAIESDLALLAGQLLDRPHAELTHRLEQLVRSYDPCISCATHFLDVAVEGGPP